MSTTRPAPLREPSELGLDGIEIVTAAAFGAVDEPGADALLGTPDQNLIPVGGDAMLYGDGGTGKTTLAIDLACHLAAGQPWLGIPIARPARVLLIENEGPRPLFRRKLQRKLAGWNGTPPDGRLHVWANPWGAFTFTDHEMQAQLARTIFELELDLVIAGPLTQLGMLDAGTLAEVRAFARLIADVRQRSLRPVAFLLVHHESKGGRVSGAWEGAGDTMLHVQGSGHGRTRVFVQKARWGSDYHARTWRLRWDAETGAETFALDDEGASRAELVWDRIVDYVRAHGGTAWGPVRKHVGGDVDYAMRRRDAALDEGILVDVATGTRGEPGHRFELWHRDDPAGPQTLENDPSGIRPDDQTDNRPADRTETGRPDLPSRSSGPTGDRPTVRTYRDGRSPDDDSATPPDPENEDIEW